MPYRVVGHLLVALSATALAALVFGADLRADTYPSQPGIDARHYAFRLTLLTSDSNDIQGEAAVTLRVVTPGVREAVLDFATPTADGKGMTVTSVTSGGRTLTVDHRQDRLHLPIPAEAKDNAGPTSPPPTLTSSAQSATLFR